MPPPPRRGGHLEYRIDIPVLKSKSQTSTNGNVRRIKHVFFEDILSANDCMYGFFFQLFFIYHFLRVRQWRGTFSKQRDVENTGDNRNCLEQISILFVFST